jgi:hypothetical protein
MCSKYRSCLVPEKITTIRHVEKKVSNDSYKYICLSEIKTVLVTVGTTCFV